MPKKIQRHHCGNNVLRAQFIPGGELILMMFDDGNIQLFETDNLAEPKMNFIPYSGTVDIEDRIKIDVSLSPRLETMVTQQRWSISGYLLIYS